MCINNNQFEDVPKEEKMTKINKKHTKVVLKTQVSS